MALPPTFWTRWRVRLGYPVALAYLWFASPTWHSIAIGGAIAALGLIVRALAAGHLRKGEGLATTGPYASTRNPLYFGSALLAAGFAGAGHSWTGAALIVGYFALFYPAVIKREEAELRAHYGRAYEDYARRVPLFWPRVPRSASSRVKAFSWALYRRNREYQAALGFLLGLAVLVLKMYWRR
jgi:protein-S-isoprenylcysteine O-methyltransferase Ste14